MQSVPETQSAAVEAVQLIRRFGNVTALNGVSLAIKPGEFFSLLGPSGCGKTTLLRMIAGLDAPDAGRLLIGGQDAAGIPAHRRPVNTVFQSYALFPHLTVRDNVAFGLRMKKVAAAELHKRVEEGLELVQITRLANRKPAQLSGGEKQRVALARALVNRPQVLLLDEPLGALDLKLRKQLQVELHVLQRCLGITFIHVTHDQDEALTMSDRIAVMNAGHVEQLGTPEELYEKPQNRFVAQFLGGCNLLEGRLVGPGEVATQLGPLRLNGSAPPFAGGEKPVTLAIRPEKVLLGSHASANRISGQVQDVVYSGAETHYHVLAGDQLIKAAVMNSVRHERFQEGAAVELGFPPESLVALQD